MIPKRMLAYLRERLPESTWETRLVRRGSASFLEFDDVIDPAETRIYILRALKSAPTLDRSAGKRRPFIDAW